MNKSKTNNTLQKDIRLTVLTGPLAYAIPIIGYCALYPIIIRLSGYKVLGLWSLFGSIPYALNTLDMGFSQHLARKASKDADAKIVSKLYIQYKIIKKIYLYLAVIISILSLLILNFHSFAELPYPKFPLNFSIILMITAVLIELYVKLESAILQARHDNYFVQVINGLTPGLLFIVAITGSLIGFPIISLALGYLFKHLCSLYIFKHRIAFKHPKWNDNSKLAKKYFLKNELIDLYKNTIHLYGVSIGLMAREPILKITITSVLGLGSLASYEIAMRVGKTARSLLATGFSSLYPSFSILLVKGLKRDIEFITQQSIILLVLLGWSGLTIVAQVSPWLYTIWLGKSSHELETATLIICIWNALTLFNIPFWYLLLAGNKEKFASFAIWIHTLSTLLIYPLSFFKTLSLANILTFWTFASIATQIGIYFLVEKYFKIFFCTLCDQQVRMAIITTILFTIIVTYCNDKIGLYQPYTGFISLAIFYGIAFILFRFNFTYWIKHDKPV